MRNSKWESPYPLLSNERDDYTTGSFQIHEENHSLSNKDFSFSFRYELNCPGLEVYLEQGNAEVILHVASPSARFRSKFKFAPNSKNIQFNVTKDNLVKNVELTAYIISTSINDFSLPEHNKEYYGNTVFKVRKGDILAESETVVIGLDDSELQKPLSSIFQITEDPNGSEFLSPYFGGEKIEIFLTPELNGKYDSLKREHISLRRALSATITLPVLVEAIEIMQGESDEQYKDLRWYRALLNRMAQYDIDLETASLSSATIANKIYGNIMLDAMTSIKNKLDDIAASYGEAGELGGVD